MSSQVMVEAGDNYGGLDRCWKQNRVRSLLLVCGGSLGRLKLGAYFDALEKRTGIRVVRFSAFQPNPRYESVVEGVRLFRAEGCDMIAAAGGGSAIDVAKCIKLFAHMDLEKSCLEQAIVQNEIPLLAIPTTAGSGSEATEFAVIYHLGEKRSVAHASCLPSAVLLDPSVLDTLPDYQKKAAMMDALCHGVESFWSIRATRESRSYSKAAIQTVLKYKDAYLQGTAEGKANMLYGANLAGKAINLAQTTAGHAMCYKLTGLYGIAHGHAAALCTAKVFAHMARLCPTPSDRAPVGAALQELASVMGCATAAQAAERFQGILDGLKLEVPSPKSSADLELLAASVNLERLNNHPIELDAGTIATLYRKILTI